ncbi:Histidine phosphatase superfamily (branch 1) [Calidithermus terrae]|uniref:Histidine phosphatase superfamily (Branch 1) n=1 Tax=Calidithermus terrae TaxID=1408545 RepID=A0A399DX27_9DEIN|nr:histidine phosphatase family protein [Calidithermus terrae]RIH75798.1 Histidine phosphatase superfamily (branch 1) [Calidithermus terrae]
MAPRLLLLLWLGSVALGQGLQGPELLGELRKGGYVIYFRHAETDQSQGPLELANKDRIPADYLDCSLQRNLDARGREQALAIGRAFRELGIPVGAVLSSPYCRCRDTAELAFGRSARSDVLLGVGVTEAEMRAKLPEFRRLLSTPPAPGTNTVLVAHLGPLNYLTDRAIELEQGEAAVIRPLGERGYGLVARLEPEGWARLAAR